MAKRCWFGVFSWEFHLWAIQHPLLLVGRFVVWYLYGIGSSQISQLRSVELGVVKWKLVSKGGIGWLLVVNFGTMRWIWEFCLGLSSGLVFPNSRGHLCMVECASLMPSSSDPLGFSCSFTFTNGSYFSIWCCNDPQGHFCYFWFV